MVHPALPGEAKIAFGKVNGTFVSGLLHKREGGKLSEKQPQLLASVPEAGQRPRDRALALPILISVLSFQGLSPTWLFFLPLLPCCHTLLERATSAFLSLHTAILSSYFRPKG